MPIAKPVIFTAVYFHALIRLSFLLFLLALITAAWAAFNYGREDAGYYRAQAKTQQALLLQENTELRQKLALQQQNGQIDTSSSDNLKLQLQSQQAAIFELNEELEVLRSLSTPNPQKAALEIARFGLTPTTQPHTFNYALILTQRLKTEKPTKGHLVWTIQGTQGGKVVNLNWAAVTRPTQPNLPIELKYFARLQGQIVLPADFVANRIVLELVIPGQRAKNAKNLKQGFEWSALLASSQFSVEDSLGKAMRE